MSRAIDHYSQPLYSRNTFANELNRISAGAKPRRWNFPSSPGPGHKQSEACPERHPFRRMRSEPGRWKEMTPRGLRALPNPLQCEKKRLPECAFSKLRAEHFSNPRGNKFKTSRGRSLSAWRIMVYSRVYLKVCEGCGGLWFRAQDRTNVYCASCETRLRSFSRPTKRRPGRPRKHTLHLADVKGGAR